MYFAFRLRFPFFLKMPSYKEFNNTLTTQEREEQKKRAEEEKRKAQEKKPQGK